jgi:hypothetical protein
MEEPNTYVVIVVPVSDSKDNTTVPINEPAKKNPISVKKETMMPKKELANTISPVYTVISDQ